MTLTQFITILTPFLTFVPLASLVVTVLYQHNSRLQESKIRSRDAIREYSISLVRGLRHYTDTQFRYIRERSSLEYDKSMGKVITDDRSRYVYGLKDTAISEQIDVQAIADNARLEISEVDFPGISRSINVTVNQIHIKMQTALKQDFEHVTPYSLDSLETDIKLSISDLARQLATIQDQITAEINDLTFISPFKKKTVNIDTKIIKK